MSDYKCIQRIFCIEKEKIEQAICEYPKAFSDGIAIVTYNNLYAENKEIGDYDAYCKFAKYFHEKGVEIQVNYSMTLGHSDELFDQKAPIRYSTMVDYTGRGCNASACPRDGKFKEYLKNSVLKYAQVKPKVFWVDDDFRIASHAPVKYGCFCEDCIKKFNIECNGNWTRESLVQAINNDVEDVRTKWQNFNRRALEDLTKLIADTVHSVDENIIIGFMQVNYSVVYYDGMDLSRFVEIAKNKNGEVWFRHGAFFYSDASPYWVVYKNLEIARLCASALKSPYKVVNLTEEVTSPYTRRAKSMRLTFLEAVMNIGVAGADGVMDEGIKPNLIEQLKPGNLVSMMHEKYDYLDALKKLIEGKRQVGVFPYYSTDVWCYNDIVTDMGQMTDMGANDWYDLFLLGIPFTFNEENSKVLLSSGKIIRTATKEYLNHWVGKAIYADGCSILEIEKKIGSESLGVKKSSYPEELLGGGRTSESFTSHPLNGDYKGFSRYNIMANATKGSACLASVGAEILSYSMNEEEAQAGIIGTAVFKNEKDGRIAVNSRGAWSSDFLSEAKGTQIKNIFDWLFGGKMPVRIDSKLRVGQSVWEDENERIIFVYNLDFDDAIDICVTNDFEGKAELLQENGDWETLGKGNKWTLPTINSWSSMVLKVRRE